MAGPIAKLTWRDIQHPACLTRLICWSFIALRYADSSLDNLASISFCLKDARLHCRSGSKFQSLFLSSFPHCMRCEPFVITYLMCLPSQHVCSSQCMRWEGWWLDTDRRHSSSPHHPAETEPLYLGQPNNNNQGHLCVRNWGIELGAVAAYGADHVRSGVFGSPYYWLIDHSSKALPGTGWTPSGLGFWLCISMHSALRLVFCEETWSFFFKQMAVVDNRKRESLTCLCTVLYAHCAIFILCK